MNKLKLSLCVFLVMLTVAAVIFMPHFFYYFNDKSRETVTVEEFSYGSFSTYANDINDVSVILNSSSSVWFEDHSENNVEIINNSAKAALDNFSRMWNPQSEISAYLDKFAAVFGNSAYESMKNYAYNVSGSVDGELMNVSLVYVETYYDDVFLSVIFDGRTEIIYELLISCNDAIFSEEEDNISAQAEEVMKNYYEYYNDTAYVEADEFTFYCSAFDTNIMEYQYDGMEYQFDGISDRY